MLGSALRGLCATIAMTLIMVTLGMLVLTTAVKASDAPDQSGINLFGKRVGCPKIAENYSFISINYGNKKSHNAIDTLDAIPTPIIAAALTLCVTLLLYRASRQRDKRALVLSMHELYLSPEFYAQVRGPGNRVRLRWYHLPEDSRNQFREVVIYGWAPGDNFKIIEAYFSPNDKTGGTIEEIISHHFQISSGRSHLTEHQALTAMLRFWGRLRVYIDLNLVNRKLLKGMFADEFHYNEEFFLDLSRSVADRTGSDKSNITPRWVKDVEILSGFFKK